MLGCFLNKKKNYVRIQRENVTRLVFLNKKKNYVPIQRKKLGCFLK